MTKAVLLAGIVFYIDYKNRYVQVPDCELTEVIYMMAGQQADLYMNKCEELTTAIIEDRVYDLNSDRRLELQGVWKWSTLLGGRIVRTTTVPFYSTDACGTRQYYGDVMAGPCVQSAPGYAATGHTSPDKLYV